MYEDQEQGLQLSSTNATQNDLGVVDVGHMDT